MPLRFLIAALFFASGARAEPPFYVADFLDVDPARPRPPLERLTFVDSRVDDGERNGLTGVFKVSLACSGRPLNRSEIDRPNAAGRLPSDGYYHDGLLARFRDGMLIDSIRVPARSKRSPASASRTLRMRCDRRLENGGSSVIFDCVEGGLDCSISDPAERLRCLLGTGRPLEPIRLRPARTAETGEFVFIDDSYGPGDPSRPRCDQGVFQVVYSQIPDS